MVVSHLINKQGKGWNQPIWVAKENITTMNGSKKVWVPKATQSPRDSGGFGDLVTQYEQFEQKPSTPKVGANWKLFIYPIPKSFIGILGNQMYFLEISISIQSLYLSRIASAYLNSFVLPRVIFHMIGCLCFCLTREQRTWFIS